MVVGEVYHPLNARDFSSFLLQVQTSGAKIIGLANGTNDTVNSIKQAREFGLIEQGIKLATPVMFITDVHALGLQDAQGMLFAGHAVCSGFLLGHER